VSVPDGLTLRAARPADLDQISALLAQRGDATDAVDLKLVVTDPDAGWDSCAVVVDGDRVVSTATLLDETLVLGGVPIPTGQVELVVTDRDYEGRGLVRALMAWAHRRSASRGHLAQVLIGIPYFYRQFDYQYAIDMPRTRAVREAPPMPEGYTVRTAGAADIAAMNALQDATQQAYDLRMPHSPECWRWLVERIGTALLLVERGGVPVGTARMTPPEDGVLLGEIAAADPLAVHALLAHAAAAAASDGAAQPNDGAVAAVKERLGSPVAAVLEPFLAPPSPHAAAYYARVPDVVALLDHLRPVLSARLAGLPTAGLPAAGADRGSDGEILLSFFRHHVRLVHRDGVVTEVRAGGTVQAPGSLGGGGCAPDLITALLFGQRGIDGLAERHPDVYPGPDEALWRALFPPVTADLLTFYLP
jgi:predicted N-acetyltransferase YhbS